MPALGNVINLNSPPSSILLPFPELKPIPPNPIQTRTREPVMEDFNRGIQLKGSNGDDRLEEIRENGGEQGEIGGNSDAVPDPDADSASDSRCHSELRFSESSDDAGGGNGRVLKPCSVVPTTAKLLQECCETQIEPKIPEFSPSMPFLSGAPKSVNCGVCQNFIHSQEELLCSVRGCQRVFHQKCAKEILSFSSSKHLKCPQHACFLCKQKNQLWRCIRCLIAFHDKCSPFPEHVIRFPDRPGEAICWRHPPDWQLEKHDVLAKSIQDVFSLLPLPYEEEEFKIDINWKHQLETKSGPNSYVHIKRNVYLIKKKRSNLGADAGCTCSSSRCSESCVCRVQCISCSRACRCSGRCSNRPFLKQKKMRIIKTEHCGWGAVAAESIGKGDFVIEYVGEVIDDAMCEKRLWDLKDQDATNFYMCELNKNFVIDATFKGNSSRFLNHSCSPNCQLEKWQVEGDTHVGVFASRSIEVGEPLTYDYRFVQFGPQVKCHCGAANCQGYLGTTRKIVFGGKSKKKSSLEISWGPKRPRTSTKTIGIVTG